MPRTPVTQHGPELRAGRKASSCLAIVTTSYICAFIWQLAGLVSGFAVRSCSIFIMTKQDLSDSAQQ